MPIHIESVIIAYMGYFDDIFFKSGPGYSSRLGTMATLHMFSILKIMDDIIACDIIRTYPISPSFTTHIYLFTALWLIALPLTFVIAHGFLSILYLIPIGYSIMKRLRIGI